MDLKKLPPSLKPRRLALNISIMLVAAGAAIFTVEVQSLVKQWRSYDQSQGITKNLENCLSNLKDMETGQRGYLLTGKPEYLAPFETGSLALMTCLSDLEKAGAAGDKESQSLSNKVTELALNKEVELRSTIALKKQGMHEEALTVVNNGHGMKHMNAIRELVVKSTINNEQNLAVLRNTLDEQLKTTQYVFLGWLTTIGFLMSVVISSMRRSQAMLRQAKDRLAYEAMHDSLTNLPNRRFLMDWLKTSIQRAQRAKSTLGIAYIDLDGFSGVNNTYGHESGDETLKWAASLLRDKLRASDFIARLGGDEFVIVSSGQSPEQLEQLAVRLQNIFTGSAPNETIPEGSVGLSIGLAMMPDHGITPDEILRAADRAMYEAKEAGKRCYRMASFESSGSNVDA